MGVLGLLDPLGVLGAAHEGLVERAVLHELLPLRRGDRIGHRAGGGRAQQRFATLALEVSPAVLTEVAVADADTEEGGDPALYGAAKRKSATAVAAKTSTKPPV